MKAEAIARSLNDQCEDAERKVGLAIQKYNEAIAQRQDAVARIENADQVIAAKHAEKISLEKLAENLAIENEHLQGELNKAISGYEKWSNARNGEIERAQAQINQMRDQKNDMETHCTALEVRHVEMKQIIERQDVEIQTRVAARDTVDRIVAQNTQLNQQVLKMEEREQEMERQLRESAAR